MGKYMDLSGISLQKKILAVGLLSCRLKRFFSSISLQRNPLRTIKRFIIPLEICKLHNRVGTFKLQAQYRAPNPKGLLVFIPCHDWRFGSLPAPIIVSHTGCLYSKTQASSQPLYNRLLWSTYPLRNDCLAPTTHFNHKGTELTDR